MAMRGSDHPQFTHGMAKTPEWYAWCGMRQRCENPKNAAWKNYGGRGIKVCERWHVFENFYADMGNRPPGRSLDRVNNDGYYAPGNCRWATRSEQTANRRSWLLPRGDSHYARTNPERLSRGADHYSRHRPEALARGSHNGFSKLDEAKVAKIKKLLGSLSQSDIAKRFDVTQSTVHLIAKGKTWKHV